MRVGTIIEPRRIAEAFLSSDDERSLTTEAKRLVKAGADHIEINGEAIAALPRPFQKKFSQEASVGLRGLHEDDGVSFSVHLPFLGGVNFTTSIDPIRRASIEVVKHIVDQCSPLAPVNYILHISGLLEELAELGVRGDAVSAAYLDYAAESLAQITEFIPAGKLCIENLEYISFSKIYPLVKEFNARVCMDVGHILLRNEEIEDFIQNYGCRVSHVHMHDVSKRRYERRVTVIDDHKELGSGIIDLDAIIRMLRELDFRGPVVLEIYGTDPVNSISILKNSINRSMEG